MAKPYRLLLLVPLSLLMACGASETPQHDNGGSTGSGGTSSNGGTTGGGTGGTTSNPDTGGTTGAGGATSPGTGGTTGAGGDTSPGTGGTTSAGGSTGNGGTTGAGGTTASGGTTGAGGKTGSGGTTGFGGKTGTGGTAPGCGMPPADTDSTTKFSLHEVHMTGIDAVYLAGGKYYDSSGKYDFTYRPYSVRLPTGYNPAKAYAVTVGGGGCGGSATGFANSPSGGQQIAPNGTTIQIGLSYLSGCFNDGGPSIGNRPDTPEQPYFRAVMADVEAHYCVDKSKIFVSGSSSGAWEAYTLGCAAGDIIRGISTDEGGMRMVRPPCTGPVAAVLVAGEADTENPIGPLDPNNKNDQGAIGRLGSYGSAPGRDELLTRNGCIGNAATAIGAFDATYTQCVSYTGCPAAYPVIWCALPGVGHNSSKYNNVDYSPGLAWKVLGALP
ncbi:MAG TPA: hypothetical protein VHJ20_01950 [Polyangia bacterium]|nr:hypothetical protein [Polyangia bacterium]